MLNSVLEKYAEKAKGNKKNPIQVVYSVGGYIGNNLKFLLAIDSKLDQAKSKLDKVLYTHVYSVQKGKLGSYCLLGQTPWDSNPQPHQVVHQDGSLCRPMSLKGGRGFQELKTS